MGDLTRAGASKEIINRVVLFAAGSSTNNNDDNYGGSRNALFQHLGIANAVESLDEEVMWLEEELPVAHLVIQARKR